MKVIELTEATQTLATYADSAPAVLNAERRAYMASYELRKDIQEIKTRLKRIEQVLGFSTAGAESAFPYREAVRVVES